MTSSATVLIIEDSATQAQLTAAQLSHYDINVVLARDGLQGLRCVEAVRPDLIVLDVNLPKMDGYQVCQRLKRDEDTRHIPIIMLTSNMSSEDALKGLAVGADDYIPKDVFAIQHLLSALESLGFLEEGSREQQ
jgi:CheY-like chemotaxis protein